MTMRTFGSLSRGIAALALLALGCTGTETGNPSATLELRLRAHSSKPEVASTGAGSGVLAVEQARVSLTHLELVGCGDTGSIATSDALAALRIAVGQPVTPQCTCT